MTTKISTAVKKDKKQVVKLVKDTILVKLAEKTGLTKKVCETVYECLSDLILEGLTQRYTVVFGALGQFKHKSSAQRECRNILTREKITIPAKGGASFVLSKKAKDVLAQVV